MSGDVEIKPGAHNLTLNIGHIDARSLNVEDKFDEISSLVIEHKLDIFAVSETWLNPSISGDLLCIPGFSPMFRLDRKDGRRAGGVALYVSSSLASIRRNDLEHDDFELLFVEIKVNSLTFVCGVCYRPPNNNSVLNDALLDHLQFCVDSINARPGTFVLLLGDFNAHFDVNDIQSSSDFGINFYRWMECNSLFQVINEPTRITAHGASILDLIITNSPGYFVNSGTLSPPYNCDHSLIYARINISFAKQKCYKRHIWDLAKVDSNMLCQAFRR